ncbi:hypothetical protein AK830_g4628 [Neonectria ditissima]|uniref:Secondary metabolism regulator LAE1 n=1 Tax=Neonectria ditissima TaxID=78410 RepID=A0A0P7BMZ1_9HYPO|nr:hypothetical protein AK830_g4628 [Neonectria ditissima]
MSDNPVKAAAQERKAAVTSADAPITATVSTAPPSHQPELVPAQDPEDEDQSDADSALGDEGASSTASITSSILEYRTIHGRTYHSDRHPTEYFTPNDEQQRESVDISHHSLTLLIGGKLFLAPISEKPQRVLDVGTGTGIWAIDFADAYPDTEVIGSDLSPIQPRWVPPNVKFEIDDATLPWSWKDDTFDFIHIRYLFGAIQDWRALFRQAYRCCAPGGWVQSCEADVEIRSDDGTTENIPALKLWAQLYAEGGRKLKTPFYVQREGLQEKGLQEAGFTDIKSFDYKLPVAGWPKDSNLAEVGRYVNLTLENDIEGYTLMLWHNVLQWPSDEYQGFLADMRRVLRNRKIHGYMSVRYVYGRKPEQEQIEGQRSR